MWELSTKIKTEIIPRVKYENSFFELERNLVRTKSSNVEIQFC